jgi:hypothetical protein
MPPPQAFGQENLVDAAAFDRNALLLVEVSLQAIERPASKGQPQALGVRQRRGDDLGALLGRVGGRTSGPRLILQALEPLLVEAMNPEVDRGPREAQVLGDLAGASSLGDGQEELRPFDEPGLGGAGRCELFKSLAFLERQFAKCDSGKNHGCTSFHLKATPFLRRTASVSSLRG